MTSRTPARASPSPSRAIVRSPPPRPPPPGRAGHDSGGCDGRRLLRQPPSPARRSETVGWATATLTRWSGSGRNGSRRRTADRIVRSVHRRRVVHRRRSERAPAPDPARWVPPLHGRASNGAAQASGSAACGQPCSAGSVDAGRSADRAPPPPLRPDPPEVQDPPEVRGCTTPRPYSPVRAEHATLIRRRRNPRWPAPPPLLPPDAAHVPCSRDDDDAGPVHPDQDEVAKTSTHRRVLARCRRPYRWMS